METFSHFKAAFDKEVKDEIRDYYILGIFFVLVGLTMISLVEFGALEYSGSKMFPYSLFLLMIFLGSYNLYGIKIRYRISCFKKSCSDQQIQNGIDYIIAAYNMDILKTDGAFYLLSFRPSAMTNLTLLNLFYDKDSIYINVRTLSQANWDFDYGKTLEKKFIEDIKTSR